MIRSTRLSVLLALLTVTGFQAYQAIELPAVAQTSACTPDQTLDIREFNLRDRARSALDNGEPATALHILKAALSITPQTQYPHNAVEQWLLEENNGTRFTRLVKLADKKETTQVLDQLYQITQRLSPNYSLIKTRSLAAIAKHYIALNQFPTAINALNQARDTVRFVQGSTEKADSLLDIAAGYATLPQPRIAQNSLAQAEKAIQQIRQSDQAVRFVRLAALHAEDENFTKAKEIAAKLPKNSEQQSIALRSIAENYITIKQLGNADQVIQMIANPIQKAIALGKVAVAYDLAKQSGMATRRFDEAMTIAATPNLVSGFYTSETLRRDLVLDLVEAGRRDIARQLAVNSEMSSFKKEAYRAILLADVRANQPLSAKGMLTQQLTEILNQQDSWQRFELANLVKTAIEAEQFDWFLQEWERISKVDFGLMDQDVERIAKAYAQKGRHVQALQWAEKLPIANRPLLQIRLKSAIALSAHQSGQTDWAKNVLQSTEQQVSSLIKASRDRLQREGGDTSEPDEIEYIGVGLIALSYAQMGDAATTKRLLDRVVKSKSNQSDMELGGRVDNPFAMFQEADQTDGALQLAIGSVFPEKRFQRLQTVASMALAQNRFEIATSIVPRLNVASGQTQLLLAIAQRYTELKQSDKALPFLAQAFKVAQTIPGDESQFDHLGNSGTVIEMDNDRGSLIEAIAVQYARLKQPSQALKVANTLKEKKTRDQALEKVRCASPA